MAKLTSRKDEKVVQSLPGDGGNHEVVQEALERLCRYAHFCAQTKSIALDFREGTLVVTGTLPSFYLKQVLQTILRDTPGVARIDNRVEVVETGPPGAHFSPSRNSDHEQHN